jgi:hypothetical protein
MGPKAKANDLKHRPTSHHPFSYSTCTFVIAAAACAPPKSARRRSAALIVHALTVGSGAHCISQFCGTRQ